MDCCVWRLGFGYFEESTESLLYYCEVIVDPIGEKDEDAKYVYQNTLSCEESTQRNTSFQVMQKGWGFVLMMMKSYVFSSSMDSIQWIHAA